MAITAIKNANVYDHDTGDFSKQTVLIENEKINAILSPNEDFPAHHLIDATGFYLTPGLIDTCSQIGLKEIGIRWEGNDGYEPHEENGCELQVIDGIYPFDNAFKDAVASGVTAAHIVSAPESVVGAKTSVIHTSGKTVDEMLLNKNLGYSFSMGDIPKNSFWEKTKSPLTRMGIAQKIRTALKNLQSTANLQEVLIFIRAHRTDDIATAIRIADEFRLPIILVHATEYPLVTSLTKDHQLSVIAGPCFQPIERGELQHLDPSLYSALFKQEVPFTFATDHPVSSVTHLQLEAALALKAGVPEKVILNGLTRDAAKLLMIDQLTGSIQKGLFADFVLWNKHPLDLTVRAVRTFIKGKEVYSWE
ncbi:amidohydrolase family protein [Neobacillus bataviensis]|uniref:amidohydrolase family protein n=1 Tax=Neobacillus bataviensis TaxID=220685 RepID=UPI001CBC600A|nr:amidohydrolase family protein [Neobacillus bataviensis]